MSNPLNLFKYLKKYGWKKTRQEWTKKYLMLETPENLLKKEIYTQLGYLGAIVFAFVVFFMKDMWSVSILFFFVFVMAFFQLKGKLIQYYKLKEMTKQFKGGM